VAAIVIIGVVAALLRGTTRAVAVAEPVAVGEGV